MAKYGCPPKFITIVRLLHDGMMARVQDDGNSSEPFLVSNGVKQGCVLAPTLFSLMFSAMLTDAFADTDIGIGIRHRMDGSVFNLRRLKAKTKVKTDTINDFLFADDCALNSISVDDMQQNVDKFAETCTNFGLTISIKKTEVMHQPAPGKTYIEPSIIINGQCLKSVDKFTYLGSTLSRNVVIDDEADARLAKANSAFGRLSKNVWNRRGITLETKIKVYRAAVLTTLLYGSETWTVYQRHAGKLNHFHTTHLRKLLGIKWQDKIPDTEVLARAGLPSIHTLLKNRNSDGQDMWLVCQIIGYPRNCCLASSSMENIPSVDLKSATKTLWKDPSTLTPGSLQHKIAMSGVLPCTMAQKLTRKREPSQRRKDGRRGNQMQIGANPLPPSPAPNVQELSVRRLVWPATYAPTNRMIWWSSSTRRTNNKTLYEWKENRWDLHKTPIKSPHRQFITNEQVQLQDVRVLHKVYFFFKQKETCNTARWDKLKK